MSKLIFHISPQWHFSAFADINRENAASGLTYNLLQTQDNSRAINVKWYAQHYPCVLNQEWLQSQPALQFTVGGSKLKVQHKSIAPAYSASESPIMKVNGSNLTVRNRSVVMSSSCELNHIQEKDTKTGNADHDIDELQDIGDSDVLTTSVPSFANLQLPAVKITSSTHAESDHLSLYDSCDSVSENDIYNDHTTSAVYMSTTLTTAKKVDQSDINTDARDVYVENRGGGTSIRCDHDIDIQLPSSSNSKHSSHISSSTLTPLCNVDVCTVDTFNDAKSAEGQDLYTVTEPFSSESSSSEIISKKTDTVDESNASERLIASSGSNLKANTKKRPSGTSSSSVSDPVAVAKKRKSSNVSADNEVSSSTKVPSASAQKTEMSLARCAGYSTKVLAAAAAATSYSTTSRALHQHGESRGSKAAEHAQQSSSKGTSQPALIQGRGRALATVIGTQSKQ